MKVVMVGSGNVASVLGSLIRRKGHSIVQVIGRNPEETGKLGARLRCPASQDFHNINSEAEICIVALSDDALPPLHKKMQAGRTPVVHTAGSVSREVLHTVSTRYGVFYPLQSLRSGMPVKTEIPILVDGNTAAMTRLLKKFAASLSCPVYQAADETRLRLHLAAVTSSNFSNHLFALTDEFCQREGIPFRLLLPLLRETVNRLDHHAPIDLQTGPAIRNDRKTIQKHLRLLHNHCALRNIYRQMTASIQELHGEK
jgi:predicted short-subunit dehydrogenase-like oxidoreductase (DUF2520 family)